MTREATSLDPEAEWEMVRKCAAGDAEASRALIEAHSPMVRAMARRLSWSQTQNEDLVQEGFLGLLKAASRFDPTKGARFATYARYWVRYHLQRFARANRRIVSLSRTRNMVKARNGVRNAVRELEQALGEPVDNETIAQMLEVDVEDVAHVRTEYASADLSIDAPTNDLQIESATPSPETEVDAALELRRCRDVVKELVATLDVRERLIVERHLLAPEGASLREIGADLGISAERVRQVERRALSRMHERLTAT